MTVDDVLNHLREQLDWRSPTGTKMGIVTLNREQAEFLLSQTPPKHDHIHGPHLARLIDE